MGNNMFCENHKSFHNIAKSKYFAKVTTYLKFSGSRALYNSVHIAMRELVCNGQLWARAALRQLRSRTVRVSCSNSLAKTQEMTAVFQYLLKSAQSLGSQDYYNKSDTWD